MSLEYICTCHTPVRQTIKTECKGVMFSKAVQHIWEQESVLHICEQAAFSGFTQCNNGVWIKKFQCLFLQCTAFWITKHLLLRIHTWECYSYAKSQVPLNMLQSVAVCCSVLQCVAVCCSVLQRVAVCCSVLALCCRVSSSSQHSREAKGIWENGFC